MDGGRRNSWLGKTNMKLTIIIEREKIIDGYIIDVYLLSHITILDFAVKNSCDAIYED